jgi:hypothetical protein
MADEAQTVKKLTFDNITPTIFEWNISFNFIKLYNLLITIVTTQLISRSVPSLILVVL